MFNICDIVAYQSNVMHIPVYCIVCIFSGCSTFGAYVAISLMIESASAITFCFRSSSSIHYSYSTAVYCFNCIACSKYWGYSFIIGLVGEETIYTGLLKLLDVGCSPHKWCMQQRQHPKYYKRIPRAIYLFAAWLNTLPGICPCYQHHLDSCCSRILAQVSFLDLRLRGCNASWKKPEQL